MNLTVLWGRFSKSQSASFATKKKRLILNEPSQKGGPTSNFNFSESTYFFVFSQSKVNPDKKYDVLSYIAPENGFKQNSGLFLLFEAGYC